MERHSEGFLLCSSLVGGGVMRRGKEWSKRPTLSVTIVDSLERDGNRGCSSLSCLICVFLCSGPTGLILPLSPCLRYQVVALPTLRPGPSMPLHAAVIPCHNSLWPLLSIVVSCVLYSVKLTRGHPQPGWGKLGSISGEVNLLPPGRACGACHNMAPHSIRLSGT